MRVVPRLLGVCLLLSGCAPEEMTGPVEVRWDREVCTRCAMAVGDRHFAAQVRGAPAGTATRVYPFDDIGCAVVWLDAQAWKADPRTEVWVKDHLSGEWIDAHTASYVTGKLTPMGYGLGAQQATAGDGMDFTRAVQHIREVDARERTHGGGHQHPASGQ